MLSVDRHTHNATDRVVDNVHEVISGAFECEYRPRYGKVVFLLSEDGFRIST